MMLSLGTASGWVSPALPKLKSGDILHEKLTTEQVSWLGSMNSIGALCGSLIFGYIISSLGSKRALMLVSIPCITFWLLIYFGTSYYHILVARYFRFDDFISWKRLNAVLKVLFAVAGWAEERKRLWFYLYRKLPMMSMDKNVNLLKNQFRLRKRFFSSKSKSIVSKDSSLNSKIIVNFTVF